MKNRNIKLIKDKLDIIIDYMDKHKELFVKNPEKDFVRNRKVNFKDIIRIVLSMKGESVDRELYDYFGGDIESIYKANVFYSQRERIKEDTFEFLFDMFNLVDKGEKTYKGYRLFAVDGSEIGFPSENTEISEDYESDLFNLNVTYDLLNKTYTNAILQSKSEINERRALIDMLKNTEHNEKTLYICDRGYPSWNVFTHFKYTQNADFLIRYPNGGSGLTLNLPDKDLDFIQEVVISTKPKSYSVMDRYYKFHYAYISSSTAWDFGKYEEIKVRIIKFEFSPGEYETIFTSLSQEEFSFEEIKRLYKMRWGVETSFKDLKSQMGLTRLSCKRTDFVKQEVFARLIMYNFSRKIINEVEEQQGKKKNVQYRTNFNMGYIICRDYFLNRISDDLIYDWILKYSGQVKGK